MARVTKNCNQEDKLNIVKSLLKPKHGNFKNFEYFNEMRDFIEKEINKAVPAIQTTDALQSPMKSSIKNQGVRVKTPKSVKLSDFEKYSPGAFGQNSTIQSSIQRSLEKDNYSLANHPEKILTSVKNVFSSIGKTLTPSKSSNFEQAMIRTYPPSSKPLLPPRKEVKKYFNIEKYAGDTETVTSKSISSFSNYFTKPSMYRK